MRRLLLELARHPGRREERGLPLVDDDLGEGAPLARVGLFERCVRWTRKLVLTCNLGIGIRTPLR